MIFVPAAVLVCPILIPINYTHGKSTATGGVSGLDTFGWSNVGLNHADRFWAHLLIGWLFIGFVCVVIWIELAYYVQILQVSRHRDICTILVEAIPRDYMTAESIKQCFSIFPGKVIGVAINEDMGRITSLALHRTALARRLELAETIRLQKAVGSCAQARGLRGSLETYIHKLLSCRLQERDPRMHLHDELRALDVRYGVELSGDIDRKRLPSAFVTFENPASAHMACQTVMNIRPGHMTPRTLVPSIDDIMWNNVNKSLLSRTLRTALSNTLILSIALICAIPVAFAGLLSQIIYLTEAVPWLGWVNELPRWSLGLIQGVLPSTILAVFIGVYATILEPLVDIQGITSHAAVSLRIQDFYFCFLFIQTTLLVSLSAGLTTIANEVGHGASLVMVLAKNLPKASNYFLSYILLQALSSSSNALLRSDLLLVKFVISPLLDKTVTQMMERNNRLFDIKLGTFIPFFTNLSCIGKLFVVRSKQEILIA